MSEQRDRGVPGATVEIEGTDENAAAVSEAVEVPPGYYMRRRWRARLRAMGWRRSSIRALAQEARAVQRSGGQWPGVYFAGRGASRGRYSRISRIVIPAAASTGSFTCGLSQVCERLDVLLTSHAGW